MQPRRGFALGRPFPFPLLVHRSWLGVGALLVAHLSLTAFGADPLWLAVLLSIVATGGVFASVLAHEAAHAVARRAVGIEVSEVTLFAFGGVARMTAGPKRRYDALGVAVAGVLGSLALGLVLRALTGTLDGRGGQLVWVVASANLALAAVNVLPAFPFDGAEALVVAWRRRGRSRGEAVRAAVRTGRVFGVAAAMLGIWLAARSTDVLTDAALGLWLAVLGVFVAIEAGRMGRLATAGAAVEGTAATWARPFTGKLRAEATIPQTGGPFAVSDGRRLEGVVLPRALAGGRGRSAAEVMVPWTSDLALDGDVPIAVALQRLAESGRDVLVVLGEGGVVRGVLDADSVRERLGAS